MYSKIYQITQDKTKKNPNEIRDNKGEMITKLVEVRNRWKQYIEELYNRNKKPMMCDLGIEDEVDVQ